MFLFQAAYNVSLYRGRVSRTLIWYMICSPHYLRPRSFLRARGCTLLRTVQVLQLGGRIEACAFENF